MCFASLGPLVSAGASMLGGSDGGASAATGAGGYSSLLPSVVGAIGNAATSGAAASGRRAVANYNASIAENNANLATLQAQDAIARGTQSESDLYRQSGQLEGRQRANTAANGISLNEGSPAAIEASTRYMRDVDLATLRNNAARSAWGYNVQSDNYRAQAKAYRAAADVSSPTASAATSLLGSASGVASKWYDLYKNAGGGKVTNDETPSGSSVFSSSGFFGN